MIDITLRCVPPSTTAQKKRVRIITSRSGKPIPVFFHGTQMRREAETWHALLAPYVPATPLTGATALAVTLTYPHLKATPKRDRHRLIPKVSKPDAGNASKHLEDLLTQMRFIEDDQQVARLTVEKYHGPEDRVGIRIVIAPMGGADRGVTDVC